MISFTPALSQGPILLELRKLPFRPATEIHNGQCPVDISGFKEMLGAGHAGWNQNRKEETCSHGGLLSHADPIGLLENHEPHGLDEVAGLHPVEIDPTRQAGRVKCDGMDARLQLLVDEQGHFPPEQVKDLQSREL